MQRKGHCYIKLLVASCMCRQGRVLVTRLLSPVLDEGKEDIFQEFAIHVKDKGRQA